MSFVSQLLLHVLTEPRCAACHANVRHMRAFCTVCAATITAADPTAGAPYLYGGALAEAVTRMKYGKRSDIALRLGRLLASHAVRETSANRAWIAPTVVVPVPLFETKLRERGFNQAMLLAKPIADALGVRCNPDVLFRQRDTQSQVGRSGAERRSALHAAFVARSLPQASRVLLIDDVKTTGATLEACTEALRAAGASSVHSLALAIAPQF